MRFEIYIFDGEGADGAMEAWAVGDYDSFEVLLSIPWLVHGCGCPDDDLCRVAIEACLEACEVRYGGVLPWIWSDDEEEIRFCWTPEMEPLPNLSGIW